MNSLIDISQKYLVNIKSTFAHLQQNPKVQEQMSKKQSENARGNN